MEKERRLSRSRRTDIASLQLEFRVIFYDTKSQAQADCNLCYLGLCLVLDYDADPRIDHGMLPNPDIMFEIAAVGRFQLSVSVMSRPLSSPDIVRGLQLLDNFQIPISILGITPWCGGTVVIVGPWTPCHTMPGTTPAG
jgi:hypothetical protein